MNRRRPGIQDNLYFQAPKVAIKNLAIASLSATSEKKLPFSRNSYKSGENNMSVPELSRHNTFATQLHGRLLWQGSGGPQAIVSASRAVVRNQNAFSHQTKFYPTSLSNLDCRPTRRISTRAEAVGPFSISCKADA